MKPSEKRLVAIILDTDHMVVLKYSHGKEFAKLTASMASSQDQNFVTTIITLEEQMRGWLALIRRSNDLQRQISAYENLNVLVEYYSRWERLAFNDIAAVKFQELRQQKIRIGTMDLKIASVALPHNSLLLTANKQDFDQVPRLQTEDWLH